MKKNSLIRNFCNISLIFLFSFLFLVFYPNSAEANCTGGSISYVGDDVVHVFTSGGTFSCAGPVSVQYLIVAGGGGGGAHRGGGGGAGGMRTGTTSKSAGSYSVSRGGGGARGTRNPWQAVTSVGGNGGNSSVFGITSTGGGGGGSSHSIIVDGIRIGAGQNGGSGGGGGGGETGKTWRGYGTSGQGSHGGLGFSEYAAGRGGGGGGRGGAGQNATSSSSGGNGGAAGSSSISGSSTAYAGGGGGAGTARASYGGGYYGRGGGGGVHNGNGVAGRSGIVILRYLRKHTVTYDGNGGSCSPSSRTWINHGSSASGPSCSRPEYTLTGYTITSGSCAGTFDSATGSCSSVTTSMTVQAQWVITNVVPNRPTNPLVNGDPHPAISATTTPEFSVVFDDPTPADDYASQYHIQVNTQADFNGTMMWDTGLTDILSNNPTHGESYSVTYAGDPLALDASTYYWRMRLADKYGLVSDWCTCSVCEFTMNQEPTEPTLLLTEGETNPGPVNTLTPNFSAIYNDPDENDNATEYQIQVNTASDFSGTTMWDSGLTEMTSTPEGTRSPDLTYDGTTLSFDGSTYYWKIRFADEHGTVSPWSTEEAYFTMNEPPTAPSDLLTENLTNPIDISTPNPKFSAIFNDPDIVDTSSYYRIQVNTNSSFTGSTMWDSTKSSMTTTDKGQRTPEIPYNGSTLTTNGSTYYWRIKLWDSVDSESPWSATASFKMEENESPTAPSGLLTDGRTNHQRVNNPNPVFSAIFNDPNTFDFSNYYEIEVNTSEDFSGTVMWDTGKEFMDTVNKGERLENVEYDGLELSLDGTTYYWRIRFWDANDAVSPWGATYFITAGAYSTYEGLRFDGNIKLD